MAVRAVPSFLQASSHPAEETRLMIGATSATATGSFAGGVASVDNGHGVINQTDLAVTQNDTPNMTVNVSAGGAFIRGTQSANQGVYHLFNDAAVSVVIAAADATNARRDLIIAQVRDAAYSGATNDARIIVVPGTPAASPVDPSLAAFPNALVLARVTVTAAKTSILTADITNTRTVANVSGKLPAFATSAAATIGIPTPSDGQGYYQNTGDTGEGPYYFNGSAYRRPWNMPWGYSTFLQNTSTGTQNMVSSTVVTGLTGTVALVANRRYKATFQINQSGTNALGQYAVQDSGSVVGSTWASVVTAGTTPITFTGVIYFTSATTSSRTIRLVGSSIVNTATLNVDTVIRQSLLIEDIGPSGAPA